MTDIDFQILIRKPKYPVIIISSNDLYSAFDIQELAQSLLLEERNRTDRPFGSAKFYNLIEKLTGNDTRPGSPERPKKQ